MNSASMSKLVRRFESRPQRIQTHCGRVLLADIGSIVTLAAVFSPDDHPTPGLLPRKGRSQLAQWLTGPGVSVGSAGNEP